MFARLLLATIVVGGLTAFAPAPFPKREARQPTGLSMQRLQGVWVVQKVETTQGGRYVNSNDNLAEVRIADTRWTFVTGRGGPLSVGRSLTLKIDPNQSPAWFDLGGDGTSQTSGIIRLRGNDLEVLYQWGRPRPGSFEKPPDGYWYIVFKRK